MKVTVVDALIYYIGDLFWLFLCAVSVLFLFVKSAAKTRTTIALWCFFSVIILYNPLAAKVFTRLVEPLTYYRFFWLVPAGIIIAAAVLKLMEAISNRFLSLLAAAAFFVLLWQGSVSFISLDSFGIPKNGYELEEDIFVLEEIITADKSWENPVIAMPSPVQMEYRTYDASVICAIRKEVYQGMGQKQYTYNGNGKRREAEYALGALLDGVRGMRPEDAQQMLERLGCDYVITGRDPGLCLTVEETGAEEVGSSKNYIVYRCKSR